MGKDTQMISMRTKNGTYTLEKGVSVFNLARGTEVNVEGVQSRVMYRFGKRVKMVEPLGKTQVRTYQFLAESDSDTKGLLIGGSMTEIRATQGETYTRARRFLETGSYEKHEN